MSSSVFEVETVLPHWIPSESVEADTVYAVWENCACQVNVALEDQCVVEDEVLRRSQVPDSSRDISSSVSVVCTRIKQEDVVHGNLAVSFFTLRFVMWKSGMTSDRRDRLEAEGHVLVLKTAKVVNFRSQLDLGGSFSFV